MTPKWNRNSIKIDPGPHLDPRGARMVAYGLLSWKKRQEATQNIYFLNILVTLLDVISMLLVVIFVKAYNIKNIIWR